MGIQGVSINNDVLAKKQNGLVVVIDKSIDDNSIFSSLQPTKVVVKASKSEIDADYRERGAKNQEEIGKYLRSKAQDKVCSSSAVATGGGIVGGVGLVCAGVAYLLGAPVTVPVSLAVLGIGGLTTGIVGFVKTNIASREKTKANSYVRQAQHTKEETAKDIVDKASSLVESAAHHTCGDNPYAKVSKEEINEGIQALGLPNIQKVVYLQSPDKDKTKNSQATVYYAEITQDEFDNVPDNNANYKGVKISEPINVDREYYDSGLLSEFVAKDNMSESEKIRFIELAQALSTNKKTAVSNKDVKNPNANKKEDVDFFDFNGDGNINAEDLALLHNVLYAKDGQTRLDNSDVKFEVPINIDMNNDGKIDKDDMKLYQKLDINADGTLNLTDKNILIKYLKARISLANRTGAEHNVIMKSFGYKNADETDNEEEYFLAQLNLDILKLERAAAK